MWEIRLSAFSNFSSAASLTAKGYGNKAFGIGGGDNSVVTIENTVIEYAKGGFAQSTFIAGDLNYGKQEAEGGCAIGVGCGIDGDYDSGILKMKNVTVICFLSKMFSLFLIY
ncbi:MAG: hypothetical protein IJ445_07110 [Clostridia bacterium]|nr:hypothetical protein [Clostridia bacterium]